MLRDRHVVVVGLGDSGLSAARHCVRAGARVTVADSREAPPQRAALEAVLPGVGLRLGAFSAATFADADMVVMSPGVSSRHPAIAAYRAAGGEVVGDVELWARAVGGLSLIHN